MPLNYDILRNWQFEDLRQDYQAKDTILYALGVGLGQPANDPDQLRFVYEANLQAMPTMAGVLGYRGFWLDDPRTGVDWKKALGGGVSIQLFKPLPANARIVSRQRVGRILDLGAGKGAILFNERDIAEEATGQVLATVEWTNFLRGDGGFGGPSGPRPEPHPIPSRAPDVEVSLPVAEQAALIFRLSGDHNPLHVDPAISAAAGFYKPVLHGQSTLGLACHAVLRGTTGYRPELLRSISVRFTSPVFPGDIVLTELWTDGPVVSFRCRVPERGAIVVDNGRAELGEAGAGASFFASLP